MTQSNRSLDERFSLITECYQRGISVYAWCKEHNIPSGTFYSWVHQLKKSGYQLPENAIKRASLPQKQEVVQVNILPDTEEIQPIVQNSISNPSSQCVVSSMILKTNDFSLEIPNGTDPNLMSTVLQVLRSSL